LCSYTIYFDACEKRPPDSQFAEDNNSCAYDFRLHAHFQQNGRFHHVEWTNLKDAALDPNSLRLRRGKMSR
jgi:hypothetical protein